MNYKAKYTAIGDLLCRHPELASLGETLDAVVSLLIETYRRDGKLLVCGNGGSASDSLHIVGELMKSFAAKRPLTEEEQKRIASVAGDDTDYLLTHLERAYPAVSLVSETALSTAFSNDVGGDLGFAQSVFGLGRAGDTLLGISTSGNSRNVILAMKTARAMGLSTIAMTGESGGRMKELADLVINVPEKETYRVQELHLPVYHALCLAVECELFGNEKR